MIKWKKHTSANYRTSDLFEISPEFINLQTKLGKKPPLNTQCWKSRLYSVHSPSLGKACHRCWHRQEGRSVCIIIL